MNTKSTEKRNLRGYKMTDKSYAKAMKRAKKDKTKVASLVEGWLVAYGEGYTVGITEDISNHQ